MVFFKDGAASFTSDSLKALVEAPSGDKVTREVATDENPLQYFLLPDAVDSFLDYNHDISSSFSFSWVPVSQLI